MWCLLPQAAVDQGGEEVGKRWAGEVVHQRVQHAVHVGEAEGDEKRQVNRAIDIAVLRTRGVQEPENAYAHSHAGQEADDEDNGHHHDEVDGPLDLGVSVHLPLAQAADDSGRAEQDDAQGQDELQEEHGIVPPEGMADAKAAAQIRISIPDQHLFVQEVTRQADGDTPQEAGDDGRRPIGDLVQCVVGMDHPEIPVHGHHGEEDDAALAVHGQHKEHQPARDVPKLPVPLPHVVVRQEWQADDQEKVGHGQVEQENPAGFPGLEVEAEDPQGKAIAQEPEHKLQPQHWWQHIGNEVIPEHTAVLLVYFQKMILLLVQVHEWSESVLGSASPSECPRKEVKSEAKRS